MYRCKFCRSINLHGEFFETFHYSWEKPRTKKGPFKKTLLKIKGTEHWECGDCGIKKEKFEDIAIWEVEEIGK